ADDAAAQPGGKLVDRGNRAEKQKHDGECLCLVSAADGKPERLAYAAATHSTDYGGSAYIDFQAKQSIAQEIGKDLGHDAEPDPLDPIGAHRTQTLLRAQVGILHHFKEQFAQCSNRMDGDSDDRGNSSDREYRQEKTGNDDLW